MATSVFGAIAARISVHQRGIFAPLCGVRASLCSPLCITYRTVGGEDSNKSPLAIFYAAISQQIAQTRIAMNRRGKSNGFRRALCEK